MWLKMGKAMRKRKEAELAEAREKALVWEFFDFACDGFFVEVGANDPRVLSQTWLLERVGWSGILVEPLPDSARALRSERPRSRVCQVAVSAPDRTGHADFFVAGTESSLAANIKDARTRYANVIKVQVVTLDSILRENGVERIDFLSIDTEGTEIDVLRGFDVEKYGPSLLLVEDIRHSLDLHRYIRSWGYRLIRRTGFNNWYVPQGSPCRVPILTRLHLFNRMYLGTPIRAWKFTRGKREVGQCGHLSKSNPSPGGCWRS